MEERSPISLTELWDWYPEVQRISRIVVKRSQEDLAGEVFLRMTKNHHLLKDKGQIYTVVRNHNVSWHRKWGRMIPHEPDWFVAQLTVSDNQIEKIHYKEVLKAIAELPDHYREVVVLAAEGYSADEIAQKLDVKDGTARSRLCRARKALAKRLNE